MRVFTRAALAVACAAGAALSFVPAAQAAPGTAAAGCRYYYTSWFHGPNGETTGSGNYAEGDIDPEGRVCRNGWWMGQYDDGGLLG
ncbi:hypothetical protein [Streptomyces sp. x-80]|uniref:hypothetical protein n=1 Tax=Streptomyces sp. x-80 TaxID=2789282 RepID=UPI0039807A9E